MHSLVVPLNGSNINVTARNSTHVQLAGQNRATKRHGVDVFVDLGDLPQQIGFVTGSDNYCRTWYWRNDVKKVDSAYFLTFLSVNNMAATTQCDPSAGPSCGFCDQLFASFEPGLLLKEADGRALDVIRKNGTGANAHLNSRNFDSCKITRDVPKLGKHGSEHFPEDAISWVRWAASDRFCRHHESGLFFRLKQAFEKVDLRSSDVGALRYHWERLRCRAFLRHRCVWRALAEKAESAPNDPTILCAIY